MEEVFMLKISNKKKAIICFVIIVVSMVIMPVTAFAKPPEGSKKWGKSINFWETDVKTVKKEDNSNKAYLSFTGAPYLCNLWLTSKKADGALATKKTKFKYKDEKKLSTGTINGDKVTLYAAREYILDQLIACSGDWKP